MPEDIPTPDQVARAERTYDPGRVPEEVWMEHLRLNAVVTAEVTPWKVEDGKIKVYMTRRPASDPLYANQLHMPGTMCNGSDKTMAMAIQRIKDKEMQGFEGEEPENVDSLYRDTPRGPEGAFIYLMKVTKGGKPEDWFDAENLPEDTIDHHKEMIKIILPKIKSRI
jgi:hypothetical protein